MKINNLEDLKKSIDRSVNIAFVVIFAISIMITCVAYFKIEKNKDQLARDQITHSVSLYKSNLSEKLSIVASSTIFQDYLRSGLVTRELLYPNFLSQVLSLLNHGITGMVIHDSDKQEIFKYGVDSGDFVTLKICYINQTLNNGLGSCKYRWTLFFSTSDVLKSLNKINSDIEQGNHGGLQIDLLQSKQFGSFVVDTASPMLIGLNIKESRDFSFYISIFLEAFTLILFSFWNRVRIKNIFIRYIALPIKNISSNLENGNVIQHMPDEIQEISNLVDKIETWKLQLDKMQQHEKQAEMGRLAVQVAHDIRSPLVALDVMLKDISGVAEEQRIIIRHAVNRIQDIANNLLVQYKKDNEPNSNDSNNLSSELVTDLISSSVSEKRAQYKNLPIEFQVNVPESIYGIFIMTNAVEFKRVLSNLLNNAVESLESLSAGKVIISSWVEDQKIVIGLSDNGCGISEDVLSRILSGNTVTKKANGHGLGLLQAIYQIENEWKGKFLIRSKPGEGTAIDLVMPMALPPLWFQPTLKVSSQHQIIVLDDDQSIHQVWHKRFQETKKTLMFHDFYRESEIISYINSGASSAALFLIDYELLGSHKSGLDIIEELNIASQSYLVTSRYEDKIIRQRCIQHGVRIIPKSYAAHIPIEVEDTLDQCDLILIDDDSLIHAVWKMAAITAGKHVKMYFTPDDFFKDSADLDSAVPIYLDVSLKNGLRGDVVSKEIYDAGFKEIYLATGHEKKHFLNIPWVKSVVGKEPPWFNV